MKGIGSAIRTLTILPFPAGQTEELASGLYWFPLVGALIGAVLWGVSWAWNWLGGGQWPAGCAGLMVAGEVILTRGLHLDGFSDWADSLAAVKKGKDERLAIMKDVHTGAFGVIAIVLSLILKFAAYARLCEVGAAILAIPALAISRGAMVELITTLPYARAQEGMGSPFVRGGSARHRVVSFVIALGTCIPFAPLGPLLLGLGLLFCIVIRRKYLASFGGITGDLMGTAGETVQIAVLFITALFIRAG